ncbi:hypothetical protein ACTFIW_000803 [Dictyostelium discoideum]
MILICLLSIALNIYFSCQKLTITLAQRVIVLAVNAQPSLSRARRNNIAKERNYSSGNNTPENSSISKSSSGSNYRSKNFNGSPNNVSSGSNNTKSANGTNNRFSGEQ